MCFILLEIFNDVEGVEVYDVEEEFISLIYIIDKLLNFNFNILDF